MTSIEEKLNQVERMIRECDLDELGFAFAILNEIIIDNRATNDRIAEALNLKGFIVGGPAPCHTEYEEDETGLIYYLKPFNYNPRNSSVLLNIVNSFTDHDMRQPFTRENKPAFIKAYEILKNDLYDTLDEESKNNLLSFSAKYDKFKQEIF